MVWKFKNKYEDKDEEIELIDKIQIKVKVEGIEEGDIEENKMKKYNFENPICIELMNEYDRTLDDISNEILDLKNKKNDFGETMSTAEYRDRLMESGIDYVETYKKLKDYMEFLKENADKSKNQDYILFSVKYMEAKYHFIDRRLLDLTA